MKQKVKWITIQNGVVIVSPNDDKSEAIPVENVDWLLGLLWREKHESAIAVNDPTIVYKFKDGIYPAPSNLWFEIVEACVKCGSKDSEPCKHQEDKERTCFGHSIAVCSFVEKAEEKDATFTNNGLQNPEFQEVRNNLSEVAKFILEVANSKKGHLGDCIGSLVASVSILNLNIDKLSKVFTEQKKPITTK